MQFTKKIKGFIAILIFAVIASVGILNSSSLSAQSEGGGGGPGPGCPNCPNPDLICAQATSYGVCVSDPTVNCRIANTYGDIYCLYKRRAF